MPTNSDTSATPARTTPTHICSFLGVDGALGDLLPADASSGPAPTTPRDRARLLDGRPHLQYTRSVERRTMRGSMTASHAKHSTAERPVRPDGPLRVIYAGRLDENQKRVLDLPRVIRAVQDLGNPVCLTIAGAGPAEERLKSLCSELGVYDKIRFLGSLDGGALADEFARHDVVLLASAFEGLPIAVLEAMGQGCVPVVSNVRSGVGGLITDGRNGFLREIGDIQGFADVLAMLQTDANLRTRMSLSAHMTIQRGSYNMNTMVESYISLFTRIVDQTRQGLFKRPAGNILPPPNLPWPEHLPGPVQAAGYYGRRLARRLQVASRCA